MANVLKRLYSWWVQKSPRDALLETLADARLFEEWEASAYQLDEVLGYDLWYGNLSSPRPALARNIIPATLSPTPHDVIAEEGKRSTDKEAHVHDRALSRSGVGARTPPAGTMTTASSTNACRPLSRLARRTTSSAWSTSCARVS